MYRYPDGTFRQSPPVRVEYAGYVRNFAELTTAERDEIGFNEAVPVKREAFTAYATEWVKGDDLVYREVAVSAVVDESARDAAAADAVRTERDRRLADSDWTQLADAPLTDGEKNAWATRRQALRDVPQQEGFPRTVAWPETPVL
jgi:hypothetical protein